MPPLSPSVPAVPAPSEADFPGVVPPLKPFAPLVPPLRRMRCRWNRLGLPMCHRHHLPWNIGIPAGSTDRLRRRRSRTGEHAQQHHAAQNCADWKLSKRQLTNGNPDHRTLPTIAQPIAQPHAASHSPPAQPAVYLFRLMAECRYPISRPRNRLCRPDATTVSPVADKPASRSTLYAQNLFGAKRACRTSQQDRTRRLDGEQPYNSWKAALNRRTLPKPAL